MARRLKTDRKWWSPAEDALAAELIRQGYSAQEIAEELGRPGPYSVYRRAVRRAQMGKSFPRFQKNRGDPYVRSAVLDLIRDGVNTIPAIAKVRGVTTDAVGLLLRKLEREGLVRRVGKVPGPRGMAGRHAHIFQVTKRWTIGDGGMSELPQSNVYGLRKDDAVQLLTPDNPRLNNQRAEIAELTPWGAHVICPAAHEGRFRAHWSEMAPYDPPEHAHRNGTVRGPQKQSLLSSPTGDPCPECGGANLVRVGSCVRCSDCYYSGGCG